ncbi:hypothetical protein Bbelb_128250 [Branchiostoma belcheri]|nr:hypothetical protein Bbelb_128250 [Branchiostoma belcheri]
MCQTTRFEVSSPRVKGELLGVTSPEVCEWGRGGENKYGEVREDFLKANYALKKLKEECVPRHKTAHALAIDYTKRKPSCHDVINQRSSPQNVSRRLGSTYGPPTCTVPGVKTRHTVSFSPVATAPVIGRWRRVTQVAPHCVLTHDYACRGAVAVVFDVRGTHSPQFTQARRTGRPSRCRQLGRSPAPTTCPRRWNRPCCEGERREETCPGPQTTPCRGAAITSGTQYIHKNTLSADPVASPATTLSGPLAPIQTRNRTPPCFRSRESGRTSVQCAIVDSMLRGQPSVIQSDQTNNQRGSADPEQKSSTGHDNICFTCRPALVQTRTEAKQK